MYAVYNGSMKKKLLILGVLFLVAIPFIASAAGLVPCGTSSTPKCTLCHLFVLGQNIVDFLTLTIAPALAVLAFAWAGFKILISGGSPGQRQEGMKIIRNTVIGLLIVFGAWIIINELLLFFAGGTTGTGEIAGLTMPWDEIICIAPLAAAPTAVTPSDDAAIRSTLTAAGIAIKSSGNCSDQNNKTCTSLSGLPSSAVDGLLALKSACATAFPTGGCPMTITGGTEIGHKTHGPGQPNVDLSIYDTTLTAFIFNAAGGEASVTSYSAIGRWYTIPGPSPYAGQYLYEYDFDSAGNRTGAHWHVQF